MAYALPTSGAWGALWDSLRKAHGMSRDRNGTNVPNLSNQEAVALANAIRDNVTGDGRRFDLWYQFVALAYGWDPSTNRLDTSAAQAARPYAADLAVELNAALLGQVGSDVVLWPDPGAFAAKATQRAVVAALKQDGATITIIPQCKDRKTGKQRVPRPPCDEHGRGPKAKDPITGAEIELPCDKPGDCDPVDPVGDPRTALGSLAWLALIAGLIYVLAPAAVAGLIAGRVSKSRRGRRN